MGGEGSMMFAQALLKLNARKRNNSFKEAKIIAAYPNKFEVKQANKADQIRLKAVASSYQKREQLRRRILWIILIPFLLGIILFLL